MGGSEHCELDLFVVDGTAQSILAQRNLKRILQGRRERFKVKVIDLAKKPEAAAENQISTTPTLVRRFPQPEVRLIGTLAEIDRVRSRLGLKTESKRS